MPLTMTNKLLDVLAIATSPFCRLLTHEGTARSAKTAVAIQEFYYSVYNSDEKYHAICGRDKDAIKDNILNIPDVGLLTTHPDCILKADRIGSTYIQLATPKGIKNIKLVNYSDARSWKKVLGGSLGVVLIDEVNIADTVFINETFSRQIKANQPLTILTLNGDDPQHECYQNFINYSKIIGDCPASIQAEMLKFQKEHGTKPGYYYMHFTMSDNPVMTPEKIKAAMAIYPQGSFYYTTKILGERGVQGDLIFDDYLKEELIINAQEIDAVTGRAIYPFKRYTIGVDIGENRACNVFTLTGWTENYRQAVCLAIKSFKRVGYAEKTKNLIIWLQNLIDTKVINPLTLEGIYVDSAESNYITDLQGVIKSRFNVPVTGSYKATIKDRIDMLIVGFSTGRVLFDKHCRKVYEAYQSAKWADGQKGKVREDMNLEINDIMDAFEYSLTRHMKALMIAGEF